jgi:RNA polymerase-binding transcription factor DksA
MNALRKIVQFAFECHHSELSRVFTIQNRTYRVCFECGQEVDYSWEQMRPREPIVAATRLASLESERHVQV